MNRDFSSQIENLTNSITSLGNLGSDATETFVNDLWVIVNNSVAQYTPSDPKELRATLNETLEDFLTSSYYFAASNNTNATAGTEILKATEMFLLGFWDSIMDSYGFEPPENDTASAIEDAGPSAEKALAALDTAQLIVSLSTTAGNT